MDFNKRAKIDADKLLDEEWTHVCRQFHQSAKGKSFDSIFSMPTNTNKPSPMTIPASLLL